MSCFKTILIILLGLINLSFAEHFNTINEEAEKCHTTKNAIQQTLQEINQSIAPSFHLELLKYYPQVIPALADWIYEDWSPYDLSLTKERLIEGFSRRLYDDQIPFTLVAFKDSHPIGVITLKSHETTELADIENGSPWVGSLHVIAEERGQGVGETLATAVANIAKQLGYRELFFYLSEGKGVSWCTKR